MIKEYEKKTNIYIGLGLLFQIAKLTILHSVSPWGALSMILGLVLFTMGCWYYSKGKGYPGYFGLLGLLLNFMGLIILAALPDKNKVVK